MTDFFVKMNEEYKQKNFPNDTVISKVGTNTKRNGIVSAVMVYIPLFLACAYGCFWCLRRTLQIMGTENGDTNFAFGITAFMGVLTLLFLLLIVKTLKAGKRKVDVYYARSAKNSKLPESDIRAFDQQAFESDCYILKMTEGLDRALSHNPHKDGFLTRDYLYLPSTALTVFRVKDLQICCLEDSIQYMNNMRVHTLKLRLTASNGITTLNDTTEEAGAALMKLLTERNSAIHTNGGNVLKMGAYAKYAKTVL